MSVRVIFDRKLYRELFLDLNPTLVTNFKHFEFVKLTPNDKFLQKLHKG